MSRSLYRSVAVLVLFSQAACTTVRVVSPSYVQSARPHSVWVTRSSGDVRLYDPYLESDSIFGLISETDEIGVPISDVTQVRAKRFDVAKTSLLLVGVIGVGLAGAIAAGVIGEGDVNPNCYYPNGLPVPNCTPENRIPLFKFRIGF